MSSEGPQLEEGLHAAGYEIWGRGFAHDEVDVRRILERTDPDVVFVQDKREWDPHKPGCFDKVAEFTHTDTLADRPDVFRVTPFKDAHQDPGYHWEAHQEIGCHAWVTYYHPDIVMHLAPWLRREHLIRTYHSLDPAEVPEYSPDDRQGCILSGACGLPYYPLRTRLRDAWATERSVPWEYLTHPGYHAEGTATPQYLQTLSRYKVAICTASILGYALRKIIEATACGCAVITDLPFGDILPRISGNLEGFPVKARSLHDIGEIVRDCVARYDPDRQAHYARRAIEFYDYRRLYAKLATDIDDMRRNYVA
jgi:hypothetical protein